MHVFLIFAGLEADEMAFPWTPPLGGEPAARTCNFVFGETDLRRAKLTEDETE